MFSPSVFEKGGGIYFKIIFSKSIGLKNSCYLISSMLFAPKRSFGLDFSNFYIKSFASADNDIGYVGLFSIINSSIFDTLRSVVVNGGVPVSIS